MADENKEDVKEPSPEEKEEKYLEALAKVHELSQTVENVVEEMKELRKKKEVVKEPQPAPENTPDIEGKIDEKLNSFKEAEATRNRERALKKIYSEHPEFNPENDPNGLKRKELEKNLERVNLNGLVEVEDFVDAFEFTIRGMGIDSSAKKEDVITPYSSTKKDYGKPKAGEDDDIKLSESEIAMAKGLGISIEKLKERLKNRKK